MEDDTDSFEGESAEESARPVRTTKSKAHKKKVLDDETLKILRSKLKAALYSFGRDYRKIFNKYDKGKDGSLHPAEFKKCVRTAMKMPPKDFSGKLCDYSSWCPPPFP